MRLFPVYGAVIGLLWTGPLWADPPDFCASLGQVAAEVARSREVGVTEAAALAEVNRQAATPELRSTLRAIIAATYADARSPEQARRYFEDACRGR